MQLAGTWKGKDRQEENMEAANTKVEQVVWVLTLILTMKRKGHSILPTKTKTCIKTKDGHGTRVAQYKKRYPYLPKSCEESVLGKTRNTKIFCHVGLRVLWEYIFITTRTRRLYRSFWLGEKYAPHFVILIRVGRWTKKRTYEST